MAEGKTITDPAAIRYLERLTASGQRIVLVRGDDRVTTYISDNAKAIGGWAPEEFSDELYSVVHPEDLHLVLAASRAIRSREATEQRFTARASYPTANPSSSTTRCSTTSTIRRSAGSSSC